MTDLSDWIINFTDGVIYSIRKDLTGILNITETFKGKTITRIGNHACSGGMVNIVDISRTKIALIKGNAFANCNSLTKVYFPNSQIILEGNSFIRSGLLELFIPELMTNITGAPFNQCPNLKNLAVDENNKNLVSKNNCIFSKNFDELIKIGNFVTEIPNVELIQKIGTFSMAGSKSLKRFEATKNLSVIETFGIHAAFGLEILNLSLSTETTILNGVFHGLFKLKTLILPPNTKIIKKGSFTLNNIRALAIPDSVTTIEKETFIECPYLQIISYFGCSDLSMSGIIVSSSCPRIKEIRVTFKYPSSHFSNYPVVFTALDYGILLIYKCPTFPICSCNYRYLITAVIVIL